VASTAGPFKERGRPALSREPEFSKPAGEVGRIGEFFAVTVATCAFTNSLRTTA
jgi:hypothetical protein